LLEEAEITIERALVAVRAVGVVESVTVTVKSEVPAAVGVPVMIPVESSRLKPAGSVPVVTDHVYGVTPPEAARVCE